MSSFTSLIKSWLSTIHSSITCHWNWHWLRKWKWDYLTVAFTIFLISFIPFTSQVYIFYSAYPPFLNWNYFGFHVVFDVCVINLYLNYILAMSTHPGTVPVHWVPRWITDSSYTEELIEVKKSVQKPRFCRTCQRYKPPRSHHCRQCQQCILKMDHHCPWVNNCIGHFNQAYFLRFLLYINLSTTLCNLGLTHQCYLLFTEDLFLPWNTIVLIFINLILCVPTWLSVGFLSIFHFNYLITNTTTIESMERDRQAYFIMDGSTVPLENIYNINLKTNLNSVFGDGPIHFKWLFYGATKSSGLKFPYRLLEDDIPLSELYPKANEVKSQKKSE